MKRLTVGADTYDFDDNSMLNTEAIQLKKVTGLGVREFGAGLNDFDPTAVTALVWLARNRAGDAVRYSDVVFDMATVKLEQLDEDGNLVTDSGTDAVDPTDAPPGR